MSYNKRSNMEDLNPTTRRYPRTLEEAFPGSPDMAEWFFRDPNPHPVGWYMVATVAIVLFLLITLLVRNICTP